MWFGLYDVVMVCWFVLWNCFCGIICYVSLVIICLYCLLCLLGWCCGWLFWCRRLVVWCIVCCFCC